MLVVFVCRLKLWRTRCGLTHSLTHSSVSNIIINIVVCVHNLPGQMIHGPLYTRSPGSKNLGPTLSILGLFVWPQVTNKMLEHWHRDISKCSNIGPKGCKIGLSNSMVSFFPPLGPIQGHKVQHLLVTWGRLKRKRFFLIQPLTPSVKPLGLVSTFAPIGMLDLGSNIEPDSS
jgi:hypothetical protein